MRFTVLLVVAALALSGCTDDEHGHSYTCPDGTEVDTSGADHHNATFDPESLCVPPQGPTLSLTGVPDMLVAYQFANVTWGMDLGDLEEGHSMMTQLRVAAEPGAPAITDGPDAFGEEVVKREHQDLPFTYDAAIRFTDPGTVYLRGYASFGAEHHWTEAYEIQVMPVQPTGTVKILTHGAGNFAGGLSPSTVEITLGETLVIQNDDAMAHTFTFSGSTCDGIGPVDVGAQSVSEEILIVHPGSCTVESDDLQTLSAQLQISEPSSS